jgi:predicted kinase
LAGVGISSGLDLGYTTRAQRREWLERGRAVGVGCELEVLEVDAEVRWGRVCERNRGGEWDVFVCGDAGDV